MLMEIFTFCIFVFLHDQKGHSVLVSRSLEAEENPWTEHQDTSLSAQPEHLWGLENKASEVWDENKSVIKCYCWEGRLGQVFKNFPYLPCLLTASQITHMVRQTYCCTKHQVEKIKVTACCKPLVSMASFILTPGVQTPRPPHARTQAQLLESYWALGHCLCAPEIIPVCNHFISPYCENIGSTRGFVKCQGHWLIFLSKILSGKRCIEGLLTKLWLGLISNYCRAKPEPAAGCVGAAAHQGVLVAHALAEWAPLHPSEALWSKGGCPESRTQAGVLPGLKSSWWCNFIQHINTAFSSWMFLFVRIANLGSIIAKIRLWCIVSFFPDI